MIETIRSGAATRSGPFPPGVPARVPARRSSPSRCRPARACGAGSDAPLAGLASSPLSDRFRNWRGRSGRRYVFTVFRLDAGLDRLPVEADAVVIAVLREPDGTRRRLWVDETGHDPRAFFGAERVRFLAARSGAELHVHLLAETAADRRAVADDIQDA